MQELETSAKDRSDNLDELPGSLSRITTKVRTRPALLSSSITGSKLSNLFLTRMSLAYARLSMRDSPICEN